MNRSIRHGRRHALTRAAAAMACASVMALGGLPALQGSASAAGTKPLDPGVRCDEKYGLTGIKQGGLPAGDASRVQSQWDTYDYVNPAKAYDGLPDPDLSQVSDNPDDYKKPEDKVKRIYATYKRALAKDPVKWADFHQWLTERYISNSGWDPRGKAFEKKVVQDHGLVGPDWICQKEVLFTDPDTRETYRRQLDAYNTRTKEIVEIKSNGKHEREQAPKDQAWAKDPKWKDSRFKYVFAEPQKPGTVKFLDELRKSAGEGRVTEYNYRSTGVEKAPAGPDTYRRTDPYMNTGNGKTGGSGGAGDMIDRSQKTPKDMAEQLQKVGKLDERGVAPRGPGGVDFSTLELRYVGKPVQGKGLDYAFSAKEDPAENSGWGGKEKAQLISDSFFTWLALKPDTFWVNLNPDEPDRIMDSKFATTDAGRILLEADLRMKHDFFEAMDPKTDLGKKYWDALPKQNGYPCMPGLRNWIEPKPAQVREQDGGIYILDAPLRLQSTAQTFKTQGPGKPICTPDEAETKAAQAVIDRLIVPAVEQEINTAPQYADLRRVYTSRVAAEWIRQQDAQQPTDYHDIINSGDVSKWPLRAPNDKWTKNDVYSRYTEIFKNGEFKYEIPGTDGTTQIYIVGGVDMSKSPKQNVTGETFNTEHRYLPRQTQTSVQAMTDNAETGGMLILGGNTEVKPATGGDGGEDGDGSTPTTTPKPGHSGDPSHPPVTHTPGPGTSAGGQQSPTTPPNHTANGGGLAHTGVTVGWAAALSAVLLAVGGALVWSKRRRNGAHS